MHKNYSRSHAKRGAILENVIDLSNKQYRNKGVADVRKIPTPVQIQGNRNGKIRGYVTKGELVDYLGVYNGRAVAFDAKETRSKTSFPLNNIPLHQYELLKSWHLNGAHAFVVVSFVSIDKTYRLSFGTLERYWEDVKNGGRKSVPVKEFESGQVLLKSENGVVLDYLKGL